MQASQAKTRSSLAPPEEGASQDRSMSSHSPAAETAALLLRGGDSDYDAIVTKEPGLLPAAPDVDIVDTSAVGRDSLAVDVYHLHPSQTVLKSSSEAELAGFMDHHRIPRCLWPIARILDNVRRHGLLPHGGVLASGFNLASATLGAGTLAMPSAMAGAGWAIGVSMLVSVCAGTVYSVRLLTSLVELFGVHTYEELARRLVGRWFERLTAVMIVAFCWGVTLVYVVAIGDILGSLLDSVPKVPGAFKGEWGHRLLTSIFWALFMMPLSLLKEINSLRYASFVGMASTVVLLCAIIAHSSEHGAPQRIATLEWGLDMVVSLPVFAFAYCCQTNVFEIYAEMHNRSVKKMTLTAAVSMGTCTLIYIAAGIAGMADFGQKVDGDILKSYPNPAATPYLVLAFIAISFTVTMAFPVCIFPTRDAILQLMGYRDAYSTPNWVRITVCVVLATASLGFGLFVSKIKVLFGVLGGLCGSSLGFVWPALFALLSGHWTRERVGLANVLATWVLLLFGITIGLFGTAMTLYQQISGK